MIYEILIRPSYSKRMTSDHLVWIESDMPTRTFEKWLKSQALLDGSGRSAVVRWSIVQTQRAAHFVLATQAPALLLRIKQLMSGTPVMHAVESKPKQAVYPALLKHRAASNHAEVCL